MLPLEDAEILRLFKDTISASRRSDRQPHPAILDTTVLNPGIRLPSEFLTSISREEGMLSLIDGAHAMVNLI